MKILRCLLMAAAVISWIASSGCSEKTGEAPPPPPAEQPAAQDAPAAPPTAAAVQLGTVQQVNASWDGVSKEIANQNYDNAVRAWIAMDQARKQAAMNEALRAEYARRAYLAQEALRQKAETDAKAREAYRALGRVMMGR